MQSIFNARLYIERREKLKKKVGSGVLLFLGNELSPMNYTDNIYPFRQDSNFLYFFGLNIPSLSAIIDIDNDKQILFGNDPSIDSVVWTGSLPSLEENALSVGILQTSSRERLFSYLSDAISKNRKIHYLPPYRPENRFKIHNLLKYSFDEMDNHISVEFIKAIISQREIKSSEEIDEIERAVNISIDMHIAALKIARPGMLEKEIAAEAQRIALSSGGGLAFPIIATKNGQTLHNYYQGNTITTGDLFLLDAGAQTEMCYCGDLSSTFPVSGKFSQKQKEIYLITQNAHRQAIAMLKPGINFMDAHFAACKEIIEGLKNIGLMKGDTEEALRAGAHALFFPCGTGHMMGLDVHDMEDLGEKWVGYQGNERSTQFGLKSLRLAKELKPGFVFTIEPGIYFIPELIDLWKSKNTNEQFLNFNRIEQYRSFGGIRNEENILITSNGYKKLGRPFYKDIETIESLMVK